VALALEGGESLKRDPVTERYVGRGDVDPELDPKRPSELQLSLERSLWEHVDGVPRELGKTHGTEDSSVTIRRF
jgi:hypothetical protein